MERFCDKCGTLVSGDGGFCPSCGAPMSSAFQGGVDLSKQGSMPSTSDPMPSQTYIAPTPVNNTYYGQSNYGQSNFSQQPIYPQNFAQNQEMSVGQWMLTIFLSGLGFIGIVLLFVWGFSNDTPIAKKNYARAMLIFQAIALVLTIFLIPFFVIMMTNLVEEFEASESASMINGMIMMSFGL